MLWLPKCNMNPKLKSIAKLRQQVNKIKGQLPDGRIHGFYI